jgi:hypothetical protein
MEAYALRFEKMWSQCGPGSWRYLLPLSPTPEALARSPALAAARCHPDTGALIPLPFCMAAHVPVNACLLLGMLTARSPAATAAWQGGNQLFNAAQFYANRNASNAVSDLRLGAALGAALASAIAVAAGLQLACARLGPAWQGGALQLAIPFLGAAAAKPLQIGLLRADECVEGVEVFDERGACVGRSAAAGRAGVAATVATRVLYLAPMLWMPYAQAALERAVPALGRHRALGLGSYLLHAAFNSSIVTPACIALFDQAQVVDGRELEEGFHGLGRLRFNKGL